MKLITAHIASLRGSTASYIAWRPRPRTFMEEWRYRNRALLAHIAEMRRVTADLEKLCQQEMADLIARTRAILDEAAK